MSNVSQQQSYLSFAQIDSLSAAEINYIEKHGLTTLVHDYQMYLYRHDILRYWVSLNVKRHTIVTFNERDHFKTWVLLTMILEDMEQEVRDFYFRKHLDEVHSWGDAVADSNDRQSSIISKLVDLLLFTGVD